MTSTTDIRSVAEVVRKARIRNRELGVTSLLVFDGDRFFQHIEGARDPVLEVAARIAADTRHHHFTILHQGVAGKARRFAAWDMAYALDSRGVAMDVLCNSRGPDAVALLEQHIPDLLFLP